MVVVGDVDGGPEEDTVTTSDWSGDDEDKVFFFIL